MGDARSTVRAIVVSMRPKQWTKNLLLFAAVIFAGRLTDPVAVARSAAAFVVFCLLSGAVYLVNDVVDVEQDRAHAGKCLRPVACGELSPRTAVVAALLVGGFGMAAALALGTAFAGVAAAYVVLQAAYSFYLKNLVILDVMALSVGFVLRALGGAAVIAVTFSPWLLACVALLALFLGFGKRRHELLLLEEGAQDHRASLGQYTPELIDQLLSAVTAATIVAYALYTFFSPASREHAYLMLTTPFVVYGLFRYLYLVYRRNLGGNPEELVLTDVPLMADIALWLVASIAALQL